MDAEVRLPTVWGLQSGGGNMEDKLRALESLTIQQLLVSFLVKEKEREYMCFISNET